ncbi:MAG: chorismate mutase [Bryobacterales bacterium]|nr:chorismate mutase [Bryobacterales bacterium]MDE0261653.1 chorismate mutase [Bryobacterales bacterium]MDE0623343.1 chorismate mutase [Bryobacterales bacterium]
MKNLSELRAEIDGLDREAVRLLNRRAECVLALAPLKRQQGRPVHEPVREQSVLGNILASNLGPLKNDSLERIFEAVIKEMREIQQERDS